MSKVSVCIPAYNHPDLLKRCVASVLLQEFSDYELIITDDSDDAQIADYVRGLNEPRLRYFRNVPALGSPQNWNRAIREARGAYIKLLHHDDYFSANDSLGSFVKALESDPEAGMAFCYSRIIYKSDNSSHLHRQTPTQIKRLARDPNFLFFSNVIGAPSAVIHRNDPSLHYDDRYQWLVDVDFYLRFLAKYPRFVSIPRPLVTVVAGESGQITTEVSRNRERVIGENLSLFAAIFNPALHGSKTLQFFAELFDEHGISSFRQLSEAFRIPPPLSELMKEVFEEKKRNVFFKKVKKRLLTSRYNKKFFGIERF